MTKPIYFTDVSECGRIEVQKSATHGMRVFMKHENAVQGKILLKAGVSTSANIAMLEDCIAMLQEEQFTVKQDNGDVVSHSFQSTYSTVKGAKNTDRSADSQYQLAQQANAGI